MRRGASLVALGAVAMLALGAAPALGACPKPKVSSKGDVARAEYPGLVKTRYCVGPISIVPGANDIRFGPTPTQRPQVPGYITRFKPNLVLPDGRVPRVDVIHLHHAVWLINANPTFAAGEEKTIIQAPPGFGWAYRPTDSWILNDMIHNLTNVPYTVYVTYDLDFVPAPAAAAAGIKTVRTKWLDVAGLAVYPVFNTLRGTGKDGKYTFPDQAPPADRGKIGADRKWTVPRDVTLIGSAGHVHPGGLWTDLKVTRDGETKMLFRSKAKYWEPAGKVSWNFAMTGTPAKWRIKLKRGDVISIRGTYDVSKASWYEQMGIMPVTVYNGVDVGGVDPFEGSYPTRGSVTHASLPENANTGGERTGMRDPTTAKPGKAPNGPIAIKDFFYSRGDLNKRTSSIPTIKEGESITFRNEDAQRGVQHSVTACKPPCNRLTGVAYPLPDGQVDFDSTTLGFRTSFATAASGRDTWSTPPDLDAGTYSYFCRIHPFMRGAFKVAK